MTKLSTIPDHQLSITCGLCKHHTMLVVANFIGGLLLCCFEYSPKDTFKKWTIS